MNEGLPEIQEKIRKAIHLTLRAWHKIDQPPAEILAKLLSVQGLLSEAGEREPHRERKAIHQALLNALGELERKEPLGAKVVREHFINGHLLKNIKDQMNREEAQVNRDQSRAIQMLADIIYRKEQVLRIKAAENSEAELPPPSYKILIGVQTAAATLIEKLKEKDSASLYFLSGLGGIGKTSLADNVARQIIRTLAFERVIWIRIKAQPLMAKLAAPELMFDEIVAQLTSKLFPGRRPGTVNWETVYAALNETPHLIVLDNLESEADTYLIFDRLNQLKGSSKFLITSRIRPNPQAGVFTLSLDELSPDNSIRLIRHHAKTINFMEMAEAPEERLGEITAAVGGNPYALKLVTGLAQVLPLSEILKEANVDKDIGQVKDMFHYIFARAWQLLSADAKNLLAVMPNVADVGAQLDQMQAITGLDKSRLLAAIQELIFRSLIELRGTAWERRYGIHRLTEAWVLKFVNDWTEED